MTCSSGDRTIFFTNISLAGEIILSSIALVRSEYHGLPLNDVLVGDTSWWVRSLLLEKTVGCSKSTTLWYFVPRSARLK